VIDRFRRFVKHISASANSGPWTVAIPFGAFAVEVLSATMLLAIVVGTEPAKRPTAPAAAASPFGVVIVIWLPITSRPVIVAFESASKALGPLAPFASEEKTLAESALSSIRTF